MVHRVASCLVLAASVLGAQELGKLRVFPPDNPWNWDIRSLPVHPDSARLIESIGADKPLHPDFGPQAGIPFCVVGGKQKKVKVEFEYADESDRGPYPIPDDAPIEGGEESDGDRHVLVIDKDSKVLYELFAARKGEKGWTAGSGAIFELGSNDLRPEGWTSADAAGLPIFPGLVRYEEGDCGEIPHALRFTVRRTRREFWWPARHFASRETDAALPPMGMRVRLKADFDLSKFSKRVQVILRCLQVHGMILADNGSDWFISGAPDERWSDDELHAIKQVKGKDLEVVQTVDDKGKPIVPKKR